MNNEEIKSYLSDLRPGVTFDETGEWLTIILSPHDWRPVAESLRHSKFRFDYLFCLTCVDWKTHLTMVYFLSSTSDRQLNIIIKANLDREHPEIETVSDIWRTAEFNEREVFEMFGVQFLRHADLRRLILTDELVGFPMRKDFEDPVNMIRL